jgi:predicted O-methyltransferase YrrM
MSFFHDNLTPRLRLLRTAFTRRFVYHDLIRMVQDYGVEYHDVRGDTGPLDFAQETFGSRLDPAPDFASAIQPWQTFTPAGAPAIFNSEPSVARFLGQLVFHRRTQTIVELGCFVGWTTAHLALGLKARGGTGRIYCVDYMQEYLDLMQANLARHGLAGLVTPLRGMSLDAPVLAALPAQADLIFLDTSHAYPDTLQEVLAYAPRLAPGGCLVMHDSIGIAGVRRSLEELPDRFRRLTFATERGNGVTVLQHRPA